MKEEKLKWEDKGKSTLQDYLINKDSVQKTVFNERDRKRNPQ